MRCALTTPFHPCHAHLVMPFGGLLSVALSVGSRRPGVTWHLALRSPDFPRRVETRRDCLADSSAHSSLERESGIGNGEWRMGKRRSRSVAECSFHPVFRNAHNSLTSPRRRPGSSQFEAESERAPGALRSPGPRGARSPLPPFPIPVSPFPCSLRPTARSAMLPRCASPVWDPLAHYPL